MHGTGIFPGKSVVTIYGAVHPLFGIRAGKAAVSGIRFSAFCAKIGLDFFEKIDNNGIKSCVL